MSRLAQFWQLINQKPLRPEHGEEDKGTVWRIFRTYFLRPHWGSLLAIVLFGSLMGPPFNYVYSAIGRYVADDIVQIQLQALDHADSGASAAETDSNTLFALEGPRKPGSITDRIEASPGRSVAEKTRMVAQLGVLLAVILVVRYLGSKVLMQLMNRVAVKVQYRMRHHVYRKLHSLPMSYHDGHSTGRLMTYLFSDVSRIQRTSLHLLQALPMNVMTMAIGACILLAIDPALSLLVFVALPAYAGCYVFFHGRLRATHRNLREREGRLNGHIANRLKNFYVVKSFVRETHEGVDFLRRTRPIIRDALAASVLGSCFAIACGIISGVCMVAVLWIGALRVRDGGMTLGTLLLFYSSAGFMFAPVARISHVAGIYHRLRAVCGKIARVLDTPAGPPEPKAPQLVPTDAPILRFQGVSMRYDDDRPAALQDVSFTLPAGRTLCVMGASGSGKTTLAKLAARVYDPTGGSVTVDGADLRDLRVADLRKMTGYVNQEPVIFDGTIRDNIRYGSERTEPEQMVTAARFAQIHDFIVQLPERYRTMTAERGLTLSGGQKQRVNLARALLYDPKLLILDDCTSALDAETEVLLVEGFEEVLKGRTALLVSHRLSIAMRCDYVLVLIDGRVAEFGTPRKLLRARGAFRELHDEQTNKGKTPLLHLAGE